jgi:LacI family transcriptional regulator
MSALCAYRDSLRPRINKTNISFLQFGEPTQMLHQEGKATDDYWHGASEETAKLGYNLNKVRMDDIASNPSRVQDILKSRGVAGLILYQADCPVENLKSILNNFSLVWLGDGPKSIHLHSVRLNRFSSMKLVWENLSTLGYQKGGLILADHNLDQNYGEWEAVHNHYQRKFVGEGHFIPSLTFNSQAGFDAQKLDQWVRRWKPQVIVSAFSEIYQLLQHLGYRVPEDIGYVSLSTCLDNKISGIDQQTASIGKIGVRLLDQLICKREQGIPKHQQIIATNGVWNQGNTLKS